ncbi:THO complex subunit 2-like [Zophobas morio]|uniref:THO complex subunit 2-like n=1 Tax=Zophobas morio TaxID=2755281 RepID=UPI0030830476
MSEKANLIFKTADAAAKDLLMVNLSLNDNEVRGIEQLKTEAFCRYKLELYKDLVSYGEKNQTVGLSLALLKIGNWTLCRKLLISVPRGLAFAYPPLSKLLQGAVHRAIQPLYDSIRPLGSSTPLRHAELLESFPEIGRVATVDGLSDKVFPMLNELGCYCDDPVLIAKLCRIGKVIVEKGLSVDPTLTSSATLQEFVDVVCLCILPSLSAMESNPGLLEELWQAIRKLPYHLRYHIYARWKHQTYQQQPTLVICRAFTIFSSKRWMRRISSDDKKVKDSGRKLGKIANGSPLIVLSDIIAKLKRYDNFVVPVVECTKFLTALSRDSMLYCLIEALTVEDCSVYVDSGQGQATWHKSLSNFIGLSLKKFKVDGSGILQFIAKHLMNNNVDHLLILEELITKMGGIETENVQVLSESQVTAMAGGSLLKQEVNPSLHMPLVPDDVPSVQESIVSSRNMSNSTERLKNTLLSNGIATSLLLSLAQQRSRVLYVEDKTRLEHRKVLGFVYDTTHDVLMQLCKFYAVSFETDALELPSLVSLLQEYHLEPEVAFTIVRPALRRRLLERQSTNAAVTRAQEQQNFVEALDEVVEIIVPVAEKIIASEKAWICISPRLYAVFWILEHADLEHAAHLYEKKIQTYKAELASLDDSDTKRRKEKEILLKNLEIEKNTRLKHCENVHHYLKQACTGWFKKTIKVPEAKEVASYFHMLCIAPRKLYSVSDALFCHSFTKLLQSFNTSNYPALLHYDLIFYEVVSVLDAGSLNEVYRFGYYLCALLDHLESWHSDKSIYEKEYSACWNSGDRKISDTLFRTYNYRWQKRLGMKCRAVFKTLNDVSVRNTLILLMRIVKFFPKVQAIGDELLGHVKAFKEQNEKEDLKTVATRYYNVLCNVQYRHEWCEGIPDLQPKPLTPAAPLSKQKLPAAPPSTVSASNNSFNDTNGGHGKGTSSSPNDNSGSDVTASSSNAYNDSGNPPDVHPGHAGTSESVKQSVVKASQAPTRDVVPSEVRSTEEAKKDATGSTLLRNPSATRPSAKEKSFSPPSPSESPTNSTLEKHPEENEVLGRQSKNLKREKLESKNNTPSEKIEVAKERGRALSREKIERVGTPYRESERSRVFERMKGDREGNIYNEAELFSKRRHDGADEVKYAGHKRHGLAKFRTGSTERVTLVEKSTEPRIRAAPFQVRAGRHSSGTHRTAHGGRDLKERKR